MSPLCVIRSRRSLVTPSQKTPSGKLDLSFIDNVPVLRCYTRTLHVYKHGPQASKVIREALSKGLVPYYPLAGRLKESSENQLHVECSGEGAWFVEASADCTLNAFDYFNNASFSIPYDELLPDQVPKSEGMEPIVQMQVTQFACGGFVIGLIFCHTVCDGLGSAQFLNAVGELARGVEHLSVSPVWQRDFFPIPKQQENVDQLANLPIPMLGNPLEHVSIDISMDEINQLKKQFLESTGQTCSTFEIVAANFWRLRTKAINFKAGTEVRLLFFANCRQLTDPPLPKGFYGNCFFPIMITAPCDVLKQASAIYVIELIQEAKTKLPIEFSKFKNGDYLRDGKDPFLAPLGYTTLFISEWGRLGFNQVDYGWGPPVHMVPIPGSSIIPVGIMGSLPLPHKGVRLMTWCVEKDHSQPFTHLMTKLI
ncbi:ATP binding cassette subfamily B4 isoform 1 [Hibiscus syriacus]|uniref:ATP binding cassette subfamily B4 isoform 1 n=1 Tax=Hibiscus syriacus TaxID=106335 RepID=A0A6A3A105_HIBSY|nr:acyl transferase 4 [Hibiscus syriacus]KAE8697981.1 ATP binding cassette subfamily B4 isoform 1 [Hibiscus syriacus]